MQLLRIANGYCRKNKNSFHMPSISRTWTKGFVEISEITCVLVITSSNNKSPTTYSRIELICLQIKIKLLQINSFIGLTGRMCCIYSISPLIQMFLLASNIVDLTFPKSKISTPSCTELSNMNTRQHN